MGDINSTYEKIVDYGIATEEEMSLITGINGYNTETLNDVIFYRTGYRDMEQYEENCLELLSEDEDED